MGRYKYMTSTKLRRRDVLAFAAGMGLGTQTRCGGDAPPTSLQPLAISMSERLTLASAYLAQESGYFRDAGFELEITRFSNTQSIPLLAGGRLDVAFGGAPASFINAVSRNMPLRIVAGREHVNPDCGEAFSLYARRSVFDGGEIDPKLRGKRFAVRSAGITEFVLDVFLEDLGMTRQDVETVDLSVREAIVALIGGKIDAILDTEFARSPEAVSPDIVKVWRFADARPGYQYSYIVFGQKMLEADVQVGGRFLAAYLHASSEFLQGKTPQFMRDFAATHGLDLEATISECRETFIEDGSIDLASLQTTVDWHRANGRVTEPVQASALADDRFVKEAQRLLRSGEWRVAADRA